MRQHLYAHTTPRWRFRMVMVVWLTGGAGVAFAQPPVPQKLSIEQAVALAHARNPEIRAAQAGVDAAQADVVIATKRPNPAITFESSGYPAFEANRPGFWSGQELTIRVDQEIELAGRRGLRTQAAEAATEVANLTTADRLRLLAAAVRRTYLAAVLATADLDVAQASLGEIDRVIALNEARFAQGEISGAEVRRLQVERLRFVEDVFAADLAVRNSRSALLALFDAPRLDQPLELTDGLNVPVPGDLPGSSPESSQRDGLLALALTHRPDVQRATVDTSIAEAATRLQRALRTPNLTFGAGYQSNFGSKSIVAGLTIPLPLFNRSQGGLARAEAERRAADARLASVKLSVRLDVQLALNAVETSRARIDYIEREYLTSARESRDIVLESYRLGVANLIDFLDAQRAFRDTQRIYNRALFDHRVSRFDLAAAVGRPISQP